MVMGEVGATVEREESPRDRDVLAIAHRTVKKVTEDIERFRFNTGVAALMSLANEMTDYLRADAQKQTFDEVVRLMLLMLAPMAPHMSHELWESTGRGDMLAMEEWPSWDPELIKEEMVTLVVQVNGKVRDRIEVAATIDAAEAERVALASPKVQPHADKVVKVISRPPNLVNLVVR
jgi:leucyl-tRNA synthetase